MSHDLPAAGMPDRAEIDDAFAHAGRGRCILAPGCTRPSFTPQRVAPHARLHAAHLAGGGVAVAGCRPTAAGGRR